MPPYGQRGLSTPITMRSSGWDDDEFAILQHAAKMLDRHGTVTEIGWGVSDETDPWFCVTETSTGDLLLHVTCINWSFITFSDAISSPLRGSDLYMVVTEAVSRILRRRTTTGHVQEADANGMLQRWRNIPGLARKSLRIK